jgi:rhodanese-related sulfurtransferase
MLKKVFALSLIAMMLLAACGPAAPAPEAPVDTPPAATEPEIPELPPAQKVAGDYTYENSGINATNLLDYLGRDDVFYIDLRNYEDYSKKHLRNFEVIPFFAYIYNEKAGEEGFPQLFKGTHDAPEAVYETSEAILNALFPKDKTLFIVCQSGGRVNMLMKMLAALDYDMSRIYNIGGMAQYTGDEYRDLITDTEELVVSGSYSVVAS